MTSVVLNPLGRSSAASSLVGSIEIYDEALACVPLSWPRRFERKVPNVAPLLTSTLGMRHAPARTPLTRKILISTLFLALSPSGVTEGLPDAMSSSVARLALPSRGLSMKALIEEARKIAGTSALSHWVRLVRVDPNPWIRRGAAIVLLTFPNYWQDAQAALALRDALTVERDEDIRLLIVEGLALHTKDPNAFDLLVFALNDSADIVRSTAAQALTKQLNFKNLAAQLRPYLVGRTSLLLTFEFKHELESLLSDCQALGIDVPFRFTMRDLRVLIRERRHGPDRRPVAVVIHAVADDDKNIEEMKNFSSGGALYSDASAIMSLTAHYRVMYYQAASNEEFAQAILSARRQAGRLIKLFMSSSHVDSDNQRAWWGPRDAGVTMAQEFANKENFLAIDNGSIFKKYPLRQQFAKGAIFVLDGCKTGLGRQKAKNLANFFRAQIPQAGKIFSTVEETDGLKFVFDPTGVVNVLWLNADFKQTKDFGYIATILNRAQDAMSAPSTVNLRAQMARSVRIAA